MKRRFLALGGALLLAAGCSGSHRAASPPTSVSAADPYAVPAVISVAYVNSVFAALFHVYGDATRSLVASRNVTSTVRADLASIFSPSLLQQQLAAAELSLRGPINNVRPDPGDGSVTVERLLSATSNCIFVETRTNLSKVLIKPTRPAASEYYELTQRSDATASVNPTPWIIGFNVAYTTPTEIGSRCAAS